MFTSNSIYSLFQSLAYKFKKGNWHIPKLPVFPAHVDMLPAEGGKVLPAVRFWKKKLLPTQTHPKDQPDDAGLQKETAVLVSGFFLGD